MCYINLRLTNLLIYLLTRQDQQSYQPVRFCYKEELRLYSDLGIEDPISCVRNFIDADDDDDDDDDESCAVAGKPRAIPL